MSLGAACTQGFRASQQPWRHPTSSSVYKWGGAKGQCPRMVCAPGPLTAWESSLRGRRWEIDGEGPSWGLTPFLWPEDPGLTHSEHQRATGRFSRGRAVTVSLGHLRRFTSGVLSLLLPKPAPSPARPFSHPPHPPTPSSPHPTPHTLDRAPRAPCHLQAEGGASWRVCLPSPPARPESQRPVHRSGAEQVLQRRVALGDVQ